MDVRSRVHQDSCPTTWSNAKDQEYRQIEGYPWFTPVDIFHSPYGMRNKPALSTDQKGVDIRRKGLVFRKFHP
jgi:hypothetical protein